LAASAWPAPTKLIAFLRRAMGGTRTVTLVTADMNLHIRARRDGLATHRLDEKYAKDQPKKPVEADQAGNSPAPTTA
jgi:hypothetical protein